MSIFTRLVLVELFNEDPVLEILILSLWYDSTGK